MSANFTKKKWALKNYAKMENDVWKKIKIDKQNRYLTLVHPQLIIGLNTKGVVDSVDLSGRAGEQIEVHYADAIISIKITDKNAQISKIRMHFANSNGNKTGIDYCNEVVDELKKYVPVIQHQLHTDEKPGSQTKVPLSQQPLHTDEKSEDQKKKIKEAFSDLAMHMYSCISTNYNTPQAVFSERDVRKMIEEYMLQPRFLDSLERNMLMWPFDDDIWKQLSLNLSRK